MEKILYRLDGFEGPLDLLLQLINRHKLSIYDIPILEITDQYMDAVAEMEENMLEVSGEFLVMAAQLLYMKSKMLLPKPKDDDEAEELRDDLAKRLEEYQRYKNLAQKLRGREFFSADMFFKAAEKIEFQLPEYSRKHNPSELLYALNNIEERKKRMLAPPKSSFSGIVGREKVSIEDMVEKVCRILNERRKVRFGAVFPKSESKPERIATFLAVLEMVKMNRIFAEYDEDAHDYVITRGNADVFG